MTREQRQPDGRERRAARLRRRATRAGLELAPELVDRLCAYLELLQQWNARMNLTALDDGDHGLDRLVIEPLAAATHISGRSLTRISHQPSAAAADPLAVAGRTPSRRFDVVSTTPAASLSPFDPPPRRLDALATNAGEKCGLKVIDIGSGGGSPAIPLRLALEGGSLLMVEARLRKAAFLREAVQRLQLEDTAVEAGRFEDLARLPRLRGAFDLITLRGVRTGGRELQQLQEFVKEGGELFLFRGGNVDDLPGELPASLEHRGTLPLVNSLGSRLLVLQKMQGGQKFDGALSASRCL